MRAGETGGGRGEGRVGPETVGQGAEDGWHRELDIEEVQNASADAVDGILVDRGHPHHVHSPAHSAVVLCVIDPLNRWLTPERQRPVVPGVGGQSPLFALGRGRPRHLWGMTGTSRRGGGGWWSMDRGFAVPAKYANFAEYATSTGRCELIIKNTENKK